MDWLEQKNRVLGVFRKYRSVILAALAGILLMSFPDSKQDIPPQKPSEVIVEQDLESELAVILSSILGAGKVDVLLTQQEGERTVYQCDEIRNEGELRLDTVLITGSTRDESGLILQILPPVYRGAIIVCEGADNARVQLDIVEAVKNVTGLSSDRIAVLKMK